MGDPGCCSKRQVLFLCSGNYYRSRFAEHLFNWLAKNDELPWQADSRGLGVGRYNNIGPVSPYTVERLHVLGIPINGDSRFPLQVSETDLLQSSLVIALKESEHRPLLMETFPSYADRVEYWHIDDLDCAEPEDALLALENQVRALAARLDEA